MAGYSGTPLPKKLGIKAGHRVVVVGSPPGFLDTLGPLPEGVVASGEATLRGTGSCDILMLFSGSRAGLARGLPVAMRRTGDTGAIWVSWPKKASGVPTDITEDVVREVALPLGLVDVKVCAVDDTWSGLRLVVRVENRTRQPGAANPPSNRRRK